MIRAHRRDSKWPNVESSFCIWVLSTHWWCRLSSPIHWRMKKEFWVSPRKLTLKPMAVSMVSWVSKELCFSTMEGGKISGLLWKDRPSVERKIRLLWLILHLKIRKQRGVGVNMDEIPDLVLADLEWWLVDHSWVPSCPSNSNCGTMWWFFYFFIFFICNYVAEEPTGHIIRDMVIRLSGRRIGYRHCALEFSLCGIWVQLEFWNWSITIGVWISSTTWKILACTWV